MKCSITGRFGKNNKGYIEIFFEDLQKGVQKMIELLYEEEELKKLKEKPLYRFEN